MPSVYVKTINGLKLVTVLASAAVLAGCISAKSAPTEAAVPAASADASATASVAAPAAPAAPSAPANDSYTVVKGNNLWNISARQEIYNVPEKWPLIYKSNKDQIKDADLIYPGQVLIIPRDYTAAEESAAIQHAKTRGAWSLGPIESSDVNYLNNN